jgi:subtilisin family serine protease
MSRSRCALAFPIVLTCLAACAPQSMAAEKLRYIVLLEDSVKHPGNVADRHAENRDADVGHVYRTALKGYAAKLAPAEARAVARDPNVALVERDHFGHAAAAQEIPTGIKRIFATANSALDIDGTDDLRADVDVAVLDTGVDHEHPDLDVVARVDCTKEAEGCAFEQGEAVDAHGTHVAGIIGAIDNGFGVVGVAAGARIWSIKVLDDEGNGFIADYVAGIDWVTNQGKIEVANGSLGWVATSTSLNNALKASVETGIVHVVSAGNEKQDASKVTPAKHDDVITVSAIADYNGSPYGEANTLWDPECGPVKIGENEELVGPDDYLYTYSNFGTMVEVTAPGVCIYSTWLSAGPEYLWLSGTSMATAHVSGAAAILASQSPPSTKEDVEAIRGTIMKGNKVDWTDTSGDVVKEPLLEVGDEEIYKLE